MWRKERWNGTSIIPNLDSIAEFRIMTNNFDAEYGNYSGGQINAITKSGANEFHGDVFEFLRNTDLDARNFYARSKGKFIQNQFGATAGGRIIRDKLFFFVDYQGTRQIVGAEHRPHSGTIPAADRQGNLADIADQLTGVVTGGYWANQLSQKLGYTVTPGEPYYTPGCTSSDDVRLPERGDSAVGSLRPLRKTCSSTSRSPTRDRSSPHPPSTRRCATTKAVSGWITTAASG